MRVCRRGADFAFALTTGLTIPAVPEKPDTQLPRFPSFCTSRASRVARVSDKTMELDRSSLSQINISNNKKKHHKKERQYLNPRVPMYPNIFSPTSFIRSTRFPQARPYPLRTPALALGQFRRRHRPTQRAHITFFTTASPGPRERAGRVLLGPVRRSGGVWGMCGAPMRRCSGAGSQKESSAVSSRCLFC